METRDHHIRTVSEVEFDAVIEHLLDNGLQFSCYSSTENREKTKKEIFEYRKECMIFTPKENRLYLTFNSNYYKSSSVYLNQLNIKEKLQSWIDGNILLR